LKVIDAAGRILAICDLSIPSARHYHSAPNQQAGQSKIARNPNRQNVKK
jgi:hypothetical protein